MKERGGSSKLSWGEKNRAVGRIFLEHALLVADVMAVVELACRASENIRFLSHTELQGNEGQPFAWKVKVSATVKLGIVPDRVFGLEFPGRDGQATRAYFFLEADRGTMPVKRRHLSQTSFFRKLLAYEATWSQSIHRTQFGFHRFRVLTVTQSAARVKSIVEACGNLERGQGLFLFADRTILEQPHNLLSARWQTGRTGETSTLLG